jgi:Na+/H+ antiporter NhaD/arsenite permease-like protein
MLWINHQLSTVPTILELFVPSFAKEPPSGTSTLVFWSGIASLLSVPVFNELTGLPPYLAMLTGLGAMWTLTDILKMDNEESEGITVPQALAKLDTGGILFFLGILMSIGVLDKSGLLKELAVVSQLVHDLMLKS